MHHRRRAASSHPNADSLEWEEDALKNALQDELARGTLILQVGMLGPTRN